MYVLVNLFGFVNSLIILLFCLLFGSLSLFIVSLSFV